jgi:predicted N-acetyltransferase YhbS
MRDPRQRPSGAGKKAMLTIRQERVSDFDAREALLDQAFGEGRYSKTSERLREDRLPAEALSFVACENGRLIGTVRLWHVTAGPGRPALLLGPLAVAASARNRGVGSALVQHALRQAQRRGYGAVLLVGDAPYYARFGFGNDKTGLLWLPGPYERHRLLACELKPGTLDGARGLISATGRLQPAPDLRVLVAGAGHHENASTPRAA